jgi:hypothetical protein
MRPNKEKISTLIGRKGEKNMQGIRQQENKSIEYSAKNTKEKYAPPYSVLKPLTNSDSDSLKSNGAR